MIFERTTLIVPKAVSSKPLFPDLVIVLGMVFIWIAWLYQPVKTLRPIAFDTFRDAASAENILAGRWLVDPALAHQPYWYAPLGPIVFAGIARLTSTTPLIVYSTSILWLNVLLPIGWYLLARVCWDRRTGLIGVPLIWLGSQWWSTHITMPMSSVQGVILLTAVLICWRQFARFGVKSAIGIGLLLALCTWWHILSGIIAAGTIGLHTLLRPNPRNIDNISTEPHKCSRSAIGCSAAMTAVVCALAVSPLAWHMLSLPQVNKKPVQYIAREMRDITYYAHTHAPLIIPLAIGAIVGALRRRDDSNTLLLAYAIVSATGVAMGYARIFFDWRVPTLLPHEFQWNLHIAFALFASRGIIISAEFLARQFASARQSAIRPKYLVMAIILLATVGPSLPASLTAKALNWKSVPPEYTDDILETAGWIKNNTNIDDTLAAIEPFDFFLIGGMTGRKLLAPPEAHTSVSVDPQPRLAAQQALFNATSAQQAAAVIDRYSVDDVLLVGEDTRKWNAWSGWGLFKLVYRSKSGFILILQTRQHSRQ